jgi:SAM-dependent methyltransferase
MRDRMTTLADEAARIRGEYARRAREVPEELYSVRNPGHLFCSLQRIRHLVRVLSAEGCFPLSDRRILDVGCGHGGWLSDFESWGARRENLAGMELDPARAEVARRRLGPTHSDGSGGADIRAGDASRLPWPDESFDLVVQATVFTSILDSEMRRSVAAEIARVLKPSGVLLWYDFFYDNPRNPNVRAVGAAEIRALFPDFRVELERVTLAPPVARRLVPVTWIGALVLEKFRLFNTHYLGVLRRRSEVR